MKKTKVLNEIKALVEAYEKELEKTEEYRKDGKLNFREATETNRFNASYTLGKIQKEINHYFFYKQ